jgi:hypothetical protein
VNWTAGPAFRPFRLAATARRFATSGVRPDDNSPQTFLPSFRERARSPAQLQSGSRLRASTNAFVAPAVLLNLCVLHILSSAMKSRTGQPRVSQSKLRIPAFSPSGSSDEPTVGAIKRALHELSRTTSGSALHEAYDLLRQLALRSGINPDDAAQQSRAAVQSQRERLIHDSRTASKKSSS